MARLFRFSNPQAASLCYLEYVADEEQEDVYPKPATKETFRIWIYIYFYALYWNLSDNHLLDKHLLDNHLLDKHLLDNHLLDIYFIN